LKKLIAVLLIIAVVFGALFLWLLGQSGAENANSETIIVDVKDTFDK